MTSCRSSGRPRGWRIALLLSPAAVVIGVFFVGGVAQAVAQSLGYQPFLPGYHWSADAYRAIWRDPAVRASLLITLRVSVLSTTLAAGLGVAAALAIRRLGRSRGWVTGLFQVNLAVPHLVGALGILLLLGQSGAIARVAHSAGLAGSPSAFPELTGDRWGWGIIVEYVWKETPFVGIIALAALSRGVSELEDAARTLGASTWQRLCHVTLPLLAAPVAAASVLVFAFTAGSYEVPYLLGRPYPATLPVVALQDFRDTDLTVRPQAMAVAVVITVFTVVLVAAYLAVARRLSGRSL
ncbi:MAG: ABC transporter permease subunit [Jatrophihabitans sp.]